MDTNGQVGNEREMSSSKWCFSQTVRLCLLVSFLYSSYFSYGKNSDFFLRKFSHWDFFFLIKTACAMGNMAFWWCLCKTFFKAKNETKNMFCIIQACFANFLRLFCLLQTRNPRCHPVKVFVILELRARGGSASQCMHCWADRMPIVSTPGGATACALNIRVCSSKRLALLYSITFTCTHPRGGDHRSVF